MEGEAKPEWCFFGIEHDDEMQGMLVADTYRFPCDHTMGIRETLAGIYVCYLSAAPWKAGYYLKRIGEQPRFDDIGTVLLEVAAYKSIESGCEGRLVLHAVEGAEPFYRKRGMIDLGSDSRHPSELVRFELSSEGAKALIE